MARLLDFARRTLRAPHCLHPIVVVHRRRRAPIPPPQVHAGGASRNRLSQPKSTVPSNHTPIQPASDREDVCSAPVRRALDTLEGRAALRRDGLVELDGHVASLGVVVAEANRQRRAQGRTLIAYPGVLLR